MLWIAHKAKDGDTLQSIAKLYKNKDPNAILKYAGNKKIAARLKKGEALKKGDVVWVLNPKGKCYVICKNGKETLLDEKQYKAFQKDVHKKMDQVLERQRRNYNSAVDRHDAQLAINKDQWFVSSVVGAFSSVDEPNWKPAKAAYKKLESVVSKRDYKKFCAAAEACEIAVTDYTNGVYAWVHGLIDTAEGTVTVLTTVREVGKFCGVLAAVTIAAPASLAAAVAVGAASNAGVGLLYDGAENAGLAANDMKTMSAAEIGKRMLVNAVTGAAGAMIAGNLIKLVKGPFVKAISSNTFIKKQAVRLATKVIPARVLEAEIKAVVAKATSSGTIHVAYLQKIADRVMIEAMTKFLVRAGTGAFSKHFGVGKLIHDAMFSWVTSAPSELAKGEKAAADAAAKHLANSGAADGFFDDFVKSNMKDFRKVLNEVLTEHAKKAEKKAA